MCNNLYTWEAPYQAKKHRIDKALGAVQRLQPILHPETPTNLDCKGHPACHQARTVQGPSAVHSFIWGQNLDSEEEDEFRLLVVEMMCLRKIMGVTCLDKIRNDKIRQTLELKHTVTELIFQNK